MNIMVVLLVASVGVVILAALRQMLTRPGGTAPFASREFLLTPEERSFLGVLELALDNRYRVFGKVRLGDIITPAKTLGAGRRTAAQERINRKRVDFVICTANRLALVGVVELDGLTGRAKREEAVDQALASAGIPLLRFPAGQGFELLEVRKKLEEMMQAASRSCAVSTAPVHPAVAARVENSSVQPDPVAALCPKCSAALVKRQAEGGLNAGKYFWMCSNYPTCWQVMEIAEG